ncbi:MAG TPA: MMPL family transporter [Thermomicrobiales bacterium]|nr:MMPL family transporter [Thermomicrobiales bacterium]
MKSFFSTEGLARRSARHPWRVIITWVVILVVAGVATSFMNTTTEFNLSSNPESEQGTDLIDQRFNTQDEFTETVIVRSDTLTVDDPAFKAHVDQITGDLTAMPDVVSGASNYYQAADAGVPTAESLVSDDRHSTLIGVQLAGNLEDVTDHADAYLSVIKADRTDGFEVYSVGDLSSNEEFNSIVEEDLVSAEIIGLPITLIILVIVFGAVVAAGVPLALALMSIIIATGMAALISQAFELSFFVSNMISMIGLAVGVDYALFTMARYREERSHGVGKDEAIGIAGSTANKAVVFSGMTVVLSLLGMFLIPSSIFRSLATGAILAVVVAVAATMTLVPALMHLLGDRIDWKYTPWFLNSYRSGSIGRKIVATLSLLTLIPLIGLAIEGLKRVFGRGDAKPAAEAGRFDDEVIHSGFWGRVTRIVMARPVVSVVLATSLLVAAAIPYFDLKIGFSGVETLPESDVKTGFEILQRDFYVGAFTPVKIVVDGNVDDPELQAGVDGLLAQMADQPDQFGQPSVETAPSNDLTLISVPLATDANDDVSYDTITSLRDDWIPAQFGDRQGDVYVTGVTASNEDFNQVIETYTPIVFAFVLGLSFILLMLAFRSIVVPIKAIILNLLSVGAAYGLMVLVFQKGYLTGFLGFQHTPTIDAWIPIFLFCVLFGLSMDYHVFLLSRIREHYDATGRNRESVAVGLQSTARIITGAALIMVTVFSSFAAGRLVSLQQMGFGLAVAVFVDATIIRSILVPAAMALLGNANWYLPRWLHWLPDLRVEGTVHSEPVSAPVTAAGGND